MTRSRQKSSSSEKGAASGHDDAPKKSPKSNGASGPAPQGPRAASCVGTLASVAFYVALTGAVGFAAFHLQQVVEEVRQAGVRQEESARRGAELGANMESVARQVESLKSLVNGLESSLGITRVELEGAVSRTKRGEVETRRLEEALQKLQNDLLRDLSEGINEVKESREKDFSSLEKTVEERLAEVSQSVKTSVAEFTESQGEAQSQLAELKSRLGDMEDPVLIKQELSAIVETVADIKAAKDASDASAEALREQIGAVRAELQTRNQEVASLSQEVETVRSVVQGTVGSLKQSLSVAEAGVQALRDKSVTLEDDVRQVADAVRQVGQQANEAAARVKKQSDDLETRVKASEESGDSLSSSMSDIGSKVETLFAKCDSFESSLAAQGQAVQRFRTGLKEESEQLVSNLMDIYLSMGELKKVKLNLTDLDQQVQDLRDRFTALEGRSGEQPEQLQSLRSVVAGLEAKAAKLEDHDRAISSLQKALQETTQTLADAAKANGKKKK